jgi:hypothetical protein
MVHIYQNKNGYILEDLSFQHSDKVAGWMTGELDSFPGWDRFLFAPMLPDRKWGPPSILSFEYKSSFPGDKAAGAWS